MINSSYNILRSESNAPDPSPPLNIPPDLEYIIVEPNPLGIFPRLRGGTEAMKMTVLKRLKEYLEKNQVRYEVGYHERVYTSQEIAAAMHVPGRDLAKVVMVKADGKMVMLVLPASYQVETKKLKKALQCEKLRIAREREFEELFPDCEVGAMPPFGNLYHLEVWVDQVLTEDEFIFFRAGSHVETLKVKYNDYARLVDPRVGDFSVHL
jgi:Ala-tRNA(Pro) deacylase